MLALHLRVQCRHSQLLPMLAAMMIPPITSSITSDLGQRAPELPNGHSREVLPRTSPRV